jgi:hypothetical protein
MVEKTKGAEKPASVTPKTTPPIVVKPGGDQPGTKALLQKAETKKK